MTNLKQRIERILELRAKATPGPWHVVHRHYAQNQLVEPSTFDISPESKPGRFTATVWKPRGFGDARPNAAFIAAVHEACDLLAELLPMVDDGKQCVWTYSGDYECAWDSSCGEKWSFIDGGPKENRVRFCHGCGKPVQVIDAQMNQENAND